MFLHSGRLGVDLGNYDLSEIIKYSVCIATRKGIAETKTF